MPKAKPWLFIVNPNAGRGKTRKKLTQITNYLAKQNFRYEMLLTESSKHATEITRDFIHKGYRKIVAIGGDGTIHEVINGIMQTAVHRKVKFGIIPLGGGNDFIRTFSMPTNWKQAIDTLKLHKLQPIDVFHTPVCYVINSLGFGLDAATARNASKIKHINGFSRYLLGLSKALFHLRMYPIGIRTDTKLFRTKSLLFSIGNGRFCGGGFQLTPTADATDGFIDACLVEKASFFTILKVLPGIKKGNHTAISCVTMLKTRTLDLEFPTPTPLYIDGEVPTKLWQGNFRIKMIHNAVNLFINPQQESTNE